MKFTLRVLTMAAVWLTGALGAFAADDSEGVKDAIILVNGTDSLKLPMSKYNRVYLTDDAFIIDSRDDDSVESLSVSYDEFSRLEFGSYTMSGVEAPRRDADSPLSYRAQSMSVASSREHNIAVVSLSGRIVASGRGCVDMSSVEAGVYVAVAADANGKYALKFKHSPR